MNFSDMQLIWDSQKGEQMFAFDRRALRRLVERDARIASRDLRLIELTAVVTLIILSITTMADTFFNGDEYFQLIGVALQLAIAGWLLARRRRREAALAERTDTLLDRVEVSIVRVRAAIARMRDLAIAFAAFVVYGVLIRILIYGWPSTETKAWIAAIGLTLVLVSVVSTEWTTHRPRLTEFESLREKLLSFSQDDESQSRES